MSSWKLKAILIVSLCFNAAVAGTIVAHLLMRGRPAQSEELDSIEHEEACRIRSQVLARGIGLSDSKTVHLEHEMVSCCPMEEEIRGRIDEERTSLLMLFHAAEPDTKAIMLKVERIAALQSEMEKSLVRKLLKSHALLDSEEREKFMVIIGCDPAHKCIQMHRTGDADSSVTTGKETE
ncbi:MAG TPA: hypothetical protein VLA34_03875 [Candidatus Krumholzibacterium sp.]|nr:hypothetical protein [Candidatus Krumholzibacterium sp.]